MSRTYVVAVAVVALLIVASASAALQFNGQELNDVAVQNMFVAFTRKYEKTYAGAEFDKRLGVFKSNLQIINLMQSADPGAEYGVTRFSDLSPEEFKAMYLSHINMGPENVPADAHRTPYRHPSALRNTPDTFDWRDHGAVTPVKNQAQCGSCYAFSAIANIEGQYFLKHGQLLSFSEQQVVDCDHTCGEWKKQNVCDSGCNGGLMWLVFQYLIANGGVESESAYKYTAVDGTCSFDNSKVVARVANYTMLPTDEAQMAAWLADNGPISIAINASWLQFYVGGVSNPALCSPNDLDHGVTIVGYGTGKTLLGKTEPYWLIKNSWGASWGEKGYFRIKRGDNKCGLASVPCSSVVA